MPKPLHCRLVTNIPTPYRNHGYRLLEQEFARQSSTFDVAFMAWTEPDRHWRFSADELTYQHVVHRGIHPVFHGINLHVNPSLLVDLRRDAPDIALIAGYASPSHVLAACAARTGALRAMWCETNLESVGNTGQLSLAVKRLIFERFDCFVVPGPRSIAYVRSIQPERSDDEFIVFPNLIDERVFVDGVDAQRGDVARIRAEHGARTDEQVWVCPARLEPVKGIKEFLPLLRGIRGVRLLVAGDGSLRGELQAMIANLELPVTLLGQQTEEQMVRLYAAADLFVLPSLSDPSPLSPIEAAAAALPLWVSDRAGNVDDVVQPGGNGWKYMVERSIHAEETLRTIVSCSRDQLQRMGESSRALYRARFDSRKCTERVVAGLLERQREPRRSTRLRRA